MRSLLSAAVVFASVIACSVASPAAAGLEHGRLVGDGIVRYHASPQAAADALPTILLESTPDELGPVPAGFGPSANFSTLPDGRTRVYFWTEAGTSLYGTGEVPGPLERTGRRTVLWNTDAFGWGDNTESLYQSHPWVLAVRADGTAFGVLVDTTYRTEIDLTATDATNPIIAFNSESPNLTVYVIDRESPKAVLEGLAELAGTMPMPPLWSMGYHQCRYSYYPDDRVMEVAQEFRDRNIPADVIWMDIDYMDGYRMFTWDPAGFPDPAGLDADLDAIGFYSIAIVDPHLKVDPGYSIFQSGNANDVWVLDRFRNPYVGPVWPGDSRFPDYLRADVRDWWADLYPPFLADGIDAIWNDMNEPAVFVSSKTMPEDNIHRADAELGGEDTHARYHNVYGMQMSRATYEGLLRARPNTRPFVLTRASALGGHRYAATWTGDNNADWYHVDVSIQNVLNMGLSGQPMVGPDIGGFNGAGTPDQFARWMGFGALLPFARGHTGAGNIDKEPWAFGPEVERTSRIAISRRYRLLPHLYTVAEESHRTGLPIARPLFLAEPQNQTLREIDNAFTIGDGLVVVADTTPGDTGTPPPPMTDRLFRFGFDSSPTHGGQDTCLDDQAGLYLREGYILPAGPAIQHTRDGYLSTLTLIVALDEAGQATGTLYEDDGDSFDYQTGDSLRTTYRARRVGDDVVVEIVDEEGNRARPSRPLIVRVLLGDGSEREAFGTDGVPLLIEDVPELSDDPFDCPEPPLPDPVAIDGLSIPEAFGPTRSRGVQNNGTTMGDNVNESNQLFAIADDAGLRIGVTGNLNGDGSALAVFIDTIPGGQNTLDVSTQSSPPAALPPLNGTRFEPAFAPDRLLLINHFQGSLFADWLTLETGLPATKRFLGSSGVGSGSGDLVNGEGSLGIRAALDNRNGEGVTESSSINAPTARHGVEILIPWEQLGAQTGGGSGGGASGFDPNTCGIIRLASLHAFPWGEIGNQVLPSLPAASGNAGFAPDFAQIPGTQTAIVQRGPAADLALPFGVLDLNDIAAFIASFGTMTPEADLADPAGVFDLADLSAFIESFAAGCP